MSQTGLTGTRIRSRQERLRICISGQRADALLVTHLPDIRYLCGFTGSNGILVVTPEASTLITDGRYTIQAKEEVTGARVRIPRHSILAEAGALLAARRGRQTVLFAPGRVTVAQFEVLRKFAGSKVKWHAAPRLVEGLREVKDEGELADLRAAARLIGDVFDEVTGLIRRGMREIDLAAEIDYRMRRKGASGPSFETIVAAGPRSALPHARPTERPIGKNELVVIDAGAILRGYCSDMTRTVFVGRAPQRVRGWYRAVREAQEAAIAKLSPGVETGEVDAAARNVLRRHRLARFFTHSTGHGLGLEVHESPRLARSEHARLACGSVVTIEPGVYVEGAGGIRIEDDVVVGKDGPEILTRATKDFLEL